MTAPVVSIIIPAYNAERFVARAVRSALAQTHRELEVIVVDDGSKDATAEVVRSFADPRVRYARQENAGAGAARNHGLSLSRGKYVGFLDADDAYLPTKLEKQVAFLESHPDVAVVYCDTLHFRAERPGKVFRRRLPTPTGDILPDLLRSSLINPNAPLYWGDVLRAGFGFPTGAYNGYSEEWDLYLRLALAGHRFAHVPGDLALVEVRRDSHTQWQKQWRMKRLLIERLEGLLAALPPERRAALGVDGILEEHRRKAVVAAVVSELPAEARRELDGLARPWPAGRAAALASRLAPRATAALVRRAWEARQRAGGDEMDADEVVEKVIG